MKSFSILILLLFALIACKKNEKTTTYSVRYDVQWNDYQIGSANWISIYYRMNDSTFYQPYMMVSGNWSHEFEGNIDEKLFLIFKGQQNYYTTSHNILKISINNQLVVSGSDSISYINN
jgi:hypothetical protein